MEKGPRQMGHYIQIDHTYNKPKTRIQQTKNKTNLLTRKKYRTNLNNFINVGE